MDSFSSLPVPPSAKSYLRRHELRDTLPARGQEAYTKMVADLVNRGKIKGFADKDEGQKQEAAEIVRRLLK